MTSFRLFLGSFSKSNIFSKHYRSRFQGVFFDLFSGNIDTYGALIQIATTSLYFSTSKLNFCYLTFILYLQAFLQLLTFFTVLQTGKMQFKNIIYCTGFTSHPLLLPSIRISVGKNAFFRSVNKAANCSLFLTRTFHRRF